MIKANAKKICIVVSSLGGGGAERSSALLSIMLSNLGYEIFIVSVLNRIDYPYKGTLLNLGLLKEKNDNVVGRIKRLVIFKKFLKTNDIDIIIDARSRTQAVRELVLAKFIYKIKTYYVIHNHKTNKVFTPYKWLNKWLYKNKIMVAVSESAKEKFQNMFQLQNISTIYNGFNFNEIEQKSNEKFEAIADRYVIYFGRLDDEHKNLKLLFEAYKLSKLPTENIKLLVLGNGPDKESLKLIVNSLDLVKDVIFKDFEANPYPFVKHSLFMVLSSRYEGFPMVIPEALSLNIPVVSVDCKSGPNEVIVQEYNGLLVENHNANALAKAMDRMYKDKELYLNCKSNAKASVKQFCEENITLQWKSILK